MPQEPLSQHPGGPQPPVGYEQPASQPPFEQAPQSAAATTVYWKEPRKSRGWIVALVAIIAVCLVSVFGIASCTSAIAGLGGSNAYDSEPLLPNTVAVIDIDSTIQYDGTTNSPDGLKQQLDVAADDSRIIAVVLRVNSGGGVATAGEEMSTYVKEFREDTGKPVVVSSASTNASAAYEISSQADYIFTAHTVKM